MVYAVALIGLAVASASYAGLAAYRGDRSQVVGLGALALALGIAAALAAADWIRRRDLEQLELAAARLAAGELTAPVAPVVRQPELHHLGEVLDGLRDTLDRREHDRVESHERLEGMARHLIEREEADRRTLGGALHHEIGELLTSVSVSLDGTQHQDPGEAAATLAEARELVGELMQRTRELAEALRPPALDELGLVAALDHRLRRFEIETGIGATLRHHLPGIQPSELVAITLFRFVEATLAQTARRPGTASVLVRLSAEIDRLQLEVTDTGVGLAAGSAVQSSAVYAVHERVHLLGGAIRTSADQGRNLVTVELPLGVAALAVPAAPDREATRQLPR